MPTTITISEQTRSRLSDYKRGEQTYDDILNTLMDRVPLEDIAADQIREHYERLATFQGVTSAELRRKLEARLRRRG